MKALSHQLLHFTNPRNRLTISYAVRRSFGSLPKKGEESIAIIDALYLMFRVHYGFANSQRLVAGELDTTIVHGFFSNILSMLKSIDPLPTHIAIAFEGNGQRFRQQIDPQYKANREPIPQDIIGGISQVQDMCRALELGMASASGYEGDDIVGTLALMANKRKMQTYVISKDKDFKQLLRPGIVILKSTDRNMRQAFTQYKQEDFENEFSGLKPSQWVDVMALAGDPTDNIKGVKGIGSKIALQLIQEFGSIENLFDNLDKVTTRRKYLEPDGTREIAERCKEIVTLKTDLTCEQMGIKGFEDFRFMPPRDEGEAAEEQFQKYELKGVKQGFNQLWGLQRQLLQTQMAS
eukprot:TRINITY_DN2795_c0_g2_i1.p1 TRINITY_DN2795_c0_g2~~TRINITY_DN2795_c0_g2_i1.p1  ORF type:complete len:400 (-),score=34.79 TRINITY_DN2795_c0_g2_i1:145-1194(-)